MFYALMLHHSGRFHSEVECKEKVEPDNHIDRDFSRWLEPHERFVSILWAGGWDEYIINVESIIPLSEKDIKSIQRQREARCGVQPTVDGYLLGIFARKVVGKDNKAKIIQHLCGGD